MFISFLYGQDTLIKQKKGILIKFSPYLLFGDYITSSAGIPLGVEFRINKKLSFDQNFSYIMPAGNGGLLITDVDKIRGIRTDSELKRYLNKRYNLTGFYLATNILYQYTDAITADYDGGLNVRRNLFALHEKIGWQSVSKKGFVFDVAFGFGARYVTSKSSYDAGGHGYSYEANPLYWYNKSYENGSKWFFSVNGSFKLGWKINFNKKN